jgi:hypothetical protein
MLRKLLVTTAPLLAGLGLAGCVASAGQPASGGGSPDEPLRCEIRSTESGGMIALEGVVEADAATDGGYQFQVVSSGGGNNTNIRQGGAFSAEAGEAVTLGRVVLGGNGAYEARLTLDANGETVECFEEVGGFL